MHVRSKTHARICSSSLHDLAFKFDKILPKRFDRGPKYMKNRS